MIAKSTALPLLVFALEQESQDLFPKDQCLFTGVGKVNAAYELLNYFAHHQKPPLVINIGTAGSATLKAGNVVQANAFIQRDMDVTPLGFKKYQTPFSEDTIPLKPNGPKTSLTQVTCGTGDSFDTSHNGEDYDVVDMEAFVLAYICHRQSIPFLSVKYISDGADGSAHDDWSKALEAGAKALKQALDDNMDIL